MNLTAAAARLAALEIRRAQLDRPYDGVLPFEERAAFKELARDLRQLADDLGLELELENRN